MRDSWEWEEKRTRSFTFLFEPGSYACSAVERLAVRAEAALERAREWFGDEVASRAITAYLAGWPEEAPGAGWTPLAGGLVAADHDTMWLMVSAEHPAPGLERAVLEIATRRRRVRAAEALGPLGRLLDALAERVGAEHGRAAGVEEAGRLEEESRWAKSPPEFLGEESSVQADSSFLLFLERTHGRAALARFVRAVLDEGPCRAAVSSCSRSLETLRGEWAASLGSRRRAVTTGRVVLGEALPLLRPHWLRVCELLSYMAIDLVFALSIPLSTKYLLDDCIAPRDYTRLGTWSVVVLGIFAVGSLAGYRRVVVAGLIGEMVLRDMRRVAFAHLQRLSMRFYARNTTGDLLSRITHDMDSVQGTLGGALPELLFQVVSLVVGAIVLLTLNWVLALVVLLPGIPLLAVVYARAGERVRPISRELQDRIGEMTGAVQENLSLQMVVKSFSLQEKARAAFEQNLARVFQSSMGIVGISGVLTGCTNMIFLGVRVMVLWIGALLVLQDRMTVGGLVAFVGLIGQVMSPVTAVAGYYQHLQAATGAFGRIRELMAAPVDVVEDPQAVELSDLEHEVRFDRVTFRYDSGETALREITLVVPAGKRVAIVGPSGAGKSTLAGLLLRLYDPDAGCIRLDGRDIREGTLASLRRQIAIVPQDTCLFDASFAENVAVGREGAAPEDVVRAARAAALHDVIEQTEEGYETRVGERGTRLSGGQRQRLAIARALIRNPRILILDEATSALDPETEGEIIETLEQVSRGRTTIAITHRLATVRHYDMLFVLDRGRLVEQGSHAELLRARGVYWRLHEEQARLMVRGTPPHGVVEADLLRVVPLFARLGDEALAALGARLVRQHCESGTEVVRQGEPADTFYLIAHGQAEVMVGGAGEARRVNVLRDGDFFGEMALLSGRSRVAMVRTTAPTELYCLAKADFMALLEREPDLRQVVLEIEAERHAAFVGVASMATAPP